MLNDAVLADVTLLQPKHQGTHTCKGNRDRVISCLSMTLTDTTIRHRKIKAGKTQKAP